MMAHEKYHQGVGPGAGARSGANALCDDEMALFDARGEAKAGAGAGTCNFKSDMKVRVKTCEEANACKYHGKYLASVPSNGEAMLDDEEGLDAVFVLPAQASEAGTLRFVCEKPNQQGNMLCKRRPRPRR
ncbi:hypothetical protein J7T55_008715 [Diaporthe amygdali]|uniref:uncharacterized protein n=1 Tax=Phomopsis amygdali TaxID=1214568 RepID=UPI0022FE2E29|nr:uncharacterized protein J7T55_008715 [Diaporthe amygdali]KAJ0121551.1 hypothetical protein J7T55_008715 [Diaporthe amygdali]